VKIKQIKNKKTARKTDIIRFNLRQRIEHVALLVTFVALAVTGLVQRFYAAALSQWVITGMGGIGDVRIVHRGFAAVFTLGIVYHLVFTAYQVMVKHQPLSMLPTFQDFRDVVTELKYHFGAAKESPRFGRYDYRQKFEYLGLMFGSAIIILSGLIMSFPVLITRVLPGQVVAAAVEFHGWEATLAVLTIIVWHIYEVILRPDISRRMSASSPAVSPGRGYKKNITWNMQL